jgi:hypothetical protein
MTVSQSKSAQKPSWIIAAYVLTCAAVLQAEPFDVVDQSSESFTSVRLLSVSAPVGQEFLPAAEKLDFVELRLSDASTALDSFEIFVNIRDTSIDGDILGTSELLMLEDCFNQPEGPGCGIGGGTPAEVRLEFPATVSLAISSTYVLEIVPGGGTSGLAIGYSFSNPYPLGRAIFSGIPESDNDLWFREGYIIPEPATLTLLGLVTVALTRDRRNGGQKLGR